MRTDTYPTSPSPNQPDILGPNWLEPLSDFEQKQQKASTELVDLVASELGRELDFAEAYTLAQIEAQGSIYDFQTKEVYKPSYRWQPFVNFWMDWMARQKKQRNYVKLALVMQSIAQRDGALVSQADDFDTWCELAKYHQRRYFKRILPVLAMLCLLFGLAATPVNAASQSVTLTYLGTEIIDENGAPIITNTYYVDCAGANISVAINIEFNDGAVQLRTGHYCQAKIYLQGAIVLVEASAAQEQTNNSLYLPILLR